MPAPASEVEICNLALSYLGQRASIASIANPESQDEINFSQHYDLTRQCLLRSYAWSFAQTETILASTGGATQDYLNQFLLPSDCLRLLSLGSSLFRIRDYKLEGRTILVSSIFTQPSISSLKIKYVTDMKDVQFFDPLFIQLLGLELANRLSYLYQRSTDDQKRINDLLKQETSKAVGTSHQESRPRRIDISRQVQSRWVPTEFLVSPNQVYWVDCP
jgi:hypothetical protein